MTRPVKAVVAKALRKARRYVRLLEEQIEEDARDYSQDDFVYPWLNSLCLSLLRKESYAAKKPQYAWGAIQGAHLARTLGIGRISLIEFGVAGGNGLRALEEIAEQVEQVFELGVDVYGFDTGKGLPQPRDYRDLPNLYRDAAFPMDIAKLKERLRKAELRLGLVEDTIEPFIREEPPPVAFIAFDLDYYSSTAAALKILAADPRLLLPRVHCYFDDIMGFTHSDYTGERLAIAEFNASHSARKISPIYGLKYFVPPRFRHAEWTEKIYLAHIFEHELYGRYDGLLRRASGGMTELRELPRRPRQEDRATKRSVPEAVPPVVDRRAS
ncbi:MAG TPA: hypothetical protein VNL14_10710 [Candidatus Acidoferrales bacterium]|nr:hypothetical protein [Candidatus Acidoferrales bacterium]